MNGSARHLSCCQSASSVGGRAIVKTFSAALQDQPLNGLAMTPRTGIDLPRARVPYRGGCAVLATQW